MRSLNSYWYSKIREAIVMSKSDTLTVDLTKKEEETHKYLLDQVEENLVKLIRSSTHHTALDNLCKALSNVRYAQSCLNGSYFYKA